MGKHQVNEKILALLKNNPRYSYNAPTIYKMFKGQINLSSIRCELRRMHELKKIVRETHGFYRINMDAETLYYIENPPTLLHGIMISMESDFNRRKQKSLYINVSSKLQNNVHGISSQNLENDVMVRLENLGFVRTEAPNRNRMVHCFYFENDRDRLVTVTVHFSGRIDIYLNCSNHPVNYFEFRDIFNYAKGSVDFLGPFHNDRVVEFGEAKDFKEVRMSGCNEVSLRVYLNHWFRIYNKERLGVTRVEQHIRCDVPVSVLLDMFERMFYPVCNGVVKPDDGRDVV
jgi:hypothetical protein